MLTIEFITSFLSGIEPSSWFAILLPLLLCWVLWDDYVVYYMFLDDDQRDTVTQAKKFAHQITREEVLQHDHLDNGYEYDYLDLRGVNLDFFLARNDGCEAVLVRDEYTRIFDQLVEPMLRGRPHAIEDLTGPLYHLCCSGVPGIGKSLFQVFVIWKILRRLRETPEECSVKEIYVRGPDPDSEYVTQLWPKVKIVFRKKLRTEGKTRRLLLIDGQMDPKASLTRGHKFLFCSEREPNYTAYKKAMFRSIMAPWSFEEVAVSNTYSKRPLTTEELAKRFETWGGVPRLLMKPPDLMATLNNFNLQQVEVLDNNIRHSENVTYKVLHLWPKRTEEEDNGGAQEEDNGRARDDTWETSFASPALAEHVTQLLLLKRKQFIIDNIVEGKNTQERIVWETFEGIGLRLFWQNKHKDSSNAIWLVRKKYQNGRWQHWKNPSAPRHEVWGARCNGEKLRYNNLRDLVVLMGLGDRLHKRLFFFPDFSNQDTFDGAIYVPATQRRQGNLILFQPTTADTHSLKLHGIRMLFEALANAFHQFNGFVRNVDKILFILAVPPYLEDCSLKQPTFTANADAATTEVETTIRDKLDVYVVKVTQAGVESI
eukprot:gb/GECG01012085.1/.p1 GENE.gb/GECG01012085.1/~~gb/GECG01012085.1/.p1  ORF type:complete len:598 (+),score=58.02 gb/GECG01012085.1/:1-1794(+)